MIKTITIDPSRIVGNIKPLHGVGSGPVTGNFTYDASEYFRAAGIPFGRTHDTEYPFGSGEYVDIHCVFPNFGADVDDPAAYNFLFTDEYLKAMLACGTKPFYRLGSTIEHQPIKRYIFPPKDNKKWGEICSHIISHYNDGWADGFEMNIEYWEIWNEPDLANRCWTGTDEQFFELYDAASKVIKRDHPEVKVGGSAFTSPFAPMCEGFLSHAREHGSPLDFFSWHGYIHTPEQASELSARAENLLDKYGFGEAESIYDEWNYVYKWDDTIQRSIDLHKTPMCASFVAAVLASLQHSRTDKAMYYDAQIKMTNWNGLFTALPMTIHGEPIKIKCEKPYFALKAWNELYKLGGEALCKADSGLYAAAASDGRTVAALVSRYDDSEPFSGKDSGGADVSFELCGTEVKSAKAYLIDETHDLEPVGFDGRTLSLAGNTAALIIFTK